MTHSFQKVQLLPHEVVHLPPNLHLHLNHLLILDNELVYALSGVVGLISVGPGSWGNILLINNMCVESIYVYLILYFNRFYGLTFSTHTHQSFTWVV